MNYWLMKSEPNAFSIDDLEKKPKQTSHWDGVRNYQVRNMMRDQMQPGDLAFFYHSSCDIPGIVGIIEIITTGYPDFTALDPEDHHYDPKSSRDNPRWYMVDVKLKEKFSRIMSLTELRGQPELHAMPLLQRGSRLSITPVAPLEWKTILAMAKKNLPE